MMRRLDYESVHEMYAALSDFMTSENSIARSVRRRPPFPPNTNSSAEGDKLFMVARFLESRPE